MYGVMQLLMELSLVRAAAKAGREYTRTCWMVQLWNFCLNFYHKLVEEPCNFGSVCYTQIKGVLSIWCCVFVDDHRGRLYERRIALSTG